ncbi:DnaT-like ssDNA-binding protein [Devosia chinhatensis]|uniref:Putative DnaT-like domain-containing protein n=1 Tax=Devosia chinhatensis TaxID=429727 RepID=A0A0F5FKM1_9HYPH|nr:DnaT-like ssDNA-binding protein [Devosia chinhatensis]KKB09401.1 hypothetical protein VE26_05540 [Devosia chinhatensis]
MSDHYGTREDANTYHAARGNASWAAATTGARDAALVRGSQSLDGLYGARYPGTITDAAQSLLWPRQGVIFRGQVFNDDVVPLPIIRAAYELALRELAAPGSTSPDYVPAGSIKRLKKGVGPLQKETEYAVPLTAAAARPVFSLIDGILAELIIAAPGGTTVTTLARF